jgi:hypothetical protein
MAANSSLRAVEDRRKVLPSKGAEWAALEERCRWAPHAREDCRVGQVCQHRRDGVGGLVVRGGALLAVEDAPALEAAHKACEGGGSGTRPDVTDGTMTFGSLLGGRGLPPYL